MSMYIDKLGDDKPHLIVIRRFFVDDLSFANQYMYV